jgi:predicted GIY-YIG superfamily endonuclease
MIRLTVPLLFAACLSYPLSHRQAMAQDREYSREAKQAINEAVIDSFMAMHDGWSSDEVILQNELNESFLSLCRENVETLNRDSKSQLQLSSDDFNWALMNLRKAGKLKSKTTKRKTVNLTNVRHIAEIVTRSVSDTHQCSIDRIVCDSALRDEFNKLAKSIDPEIDLYRVRKAAFQLRKARRLRPELITRIADWGRTINTYSTAKIVQDPKVLNEHPGIYIFRDATGYLYIGQTDNLRERLKKHLDESHNLSLAKYLKSEAKEGISIEVHDFDPKSKASKTMVRRAYESELIASRKPRFNVQP